MPRPLTLPDSPRSPTQVNFAADSKPGQSSPRPAPLNTSPKAAADLDSLLPAISGCVRRTSVYYDAMQQVMFLAWPTQSACRGPRSTRVPVAASLSGADPPMPQMSENEREMTELTEVSRLPNDRRAQKVRGGLVGTSYVTRA